MIKTSSNPIFSNSKSFHSQTFDLILNFDVKLFRLELFLKWAISSIFFKTVILTLALLILNNLWLDSNPGFPVNEATAVPTVPQSLLTFYSFVIFKNVGLKSLIMD